MYKVVEIKTHPNGNTYSALVMADHLTLETARELAEAANKKWSARSSHFYRIGDHTDPGSPQYKDEAALRAGLGH